ncbi:hypothetical protein [Frondihabitans cladoniiphilus]|uniref:Excreted virulence factor EspC (Type VII ESX diderm) n=1 Tax=Frondihabitans cladoniiphilus TaxID=715785 RepID=A0ABP8WCG6_9MICO
MPDYSVDPEAVANMATAVGHCSDALPEGDLPDADACGSHRVAEALSEYSMWRRVLCNQARASLSSLSTNARRAAEEYAAADQSIEIQAGAEAVGARR